MNEKENTYTENDKQFVKELMHSGIKGMKWGKRRFQNKDGSLTAEGKRRYGHITGSPERKRAIDVDDLKGKKSIADGISTAADKASSQTKKVASLYGPSKKAIEEARSMSNAELNNRIERIKKEQEYASLNPSKKAQRAERAAEVLSVVGSIAATAAAVATTAMAIREFRS